MRAVVLCLAILLSGPVFTGIQPAGAQDNTIDVPADDAEMNAAIAKARASLPQFWVTFDNPPAGVEMFSLKVRITDENGTEHFWTEKIERTDGKILATIANDPQWVKSVVVGQRIEVVKADITDWMFVRNGKIVGNETMRPLLKCLSKNKLNRMNHL